MPEELEDAFGDIIKKARAGLGYTTDEIAHETSISVDDLFDMETYRLNPTPEQVSVLASALRLDGARLLAISDGSWHPQADIKSHGGAVLERIRVPINSYSSNCYILGCPQMHECAVVDPGGAVDDILSSIDRLGLRLSTVMVTHGHADHIGGLTELVRMYPSVAVISPCERVHGPYVRHPEEGDEFYIGSLPVKAVLTPGHTEGSTCYCVNGSIAFVGDTLFAGSVGGTGGIPEAYRRELESIRVKIFSFPDDTLILPGHGPATTVGEEKKHNPFF